MTFLTVPYKTLKVWTIIGLARNCSVNVLVHNDDTILYSVVVALSELTLNGFFTLVMA